MSFGGDGIQVVARDEGGRPSFPPLPARMGLGDPREAAQLALRLAKEGPSQPA
jgi:hypothetical protein